MVRYYGRARQITGTVFTNQPGLKQAGCPSTIGKRGAVVRFLGRRVNCNLKTCGGPMSGLRCKYGVRNAIGTEKGYDQHSNNPAKKDYCHQVINKWNGVHCRWPQPKNRQMAGGVGNIWTPRRDHCEQTCSLGWDELQKMKYPHATLPAYGGTAQPFPLLALLDLSSPNHQNHQATIIIRYTNHRFSVNANETVTTPMSTNDFNNVQLVASEFYKPGGNHQYTSFSLPAILYERGNTNEITFINKLQQATNFHPHGLNCDGFVDGASEENQFGPNTAIGEKITYKYPIFNNSMTSAWHVHPMTRASPLLNGGFYMPYIIGDQFSKQLDPYFSLNQNDIPIVFSSRDLDPNGRVLAARLYSFQCYPQPSDAPMLKASFPNIPTDGSGTPCLWLTWRARWLCMNGQATSPFRPTQFCPNGVSRGSASSCSTDFFCIPSLKPCYNDYKQVFDHTVRSNLLRLRLVHVGTSFRNIYFGFVDQHKKFMDFWIIASGGGLTTPWKTKIIGLESLTRYETVVDFGSNDQISLVVFDFDITLLEKTIPFAFGNNYTHAATILNRLSVYDGSLTSLTGENTGTIFEENSESRNIFLHLLNFTQGTQVTTLPFYESIKFHRSQTNPTYTQLPLILSTVNNITANPNNYYYNYPDDLLDIPTRRIVLLYGMAQMSESWISGYEGNKSSLKFKLTPPAGFANIDMMANTEFTVVDVTAVPPPAIPITYNLSLPPTTDPIDLPTLRNTINNVFLANGLHLEWDYDDTATVSINISPTATPIMKTINIVNITLKNTGTTTYKISGNYSAMKLMGVAFFLAPTPLEAGVKTSLFMALDPTVAQPNVVVANNPSNPVTGTATLTLGPGASHTQNPFRKLDDNIFNFSVTQGTTERWIYINGDTQQFDDHPLHFHMTQGFIDDAYTSPINRHNANRGSTDTYYIKAGTQLAFKIKFPNFNSTQKGLSQDGIPHLGYMYHCHYMMHHDTNMMGQFYVNPAI